MIRATGITLIKENPQAHGILDTITETRRTVMAEIRSVGMNEMYTAMSQGLNPSYVFTLTLAEEYEGEKRLEYAGELYRVLRTYVNKSDGIELTAERWTNDE